MPKLIVVILIVIGFVIAYSKLKDKSEEKIELENNISKERLEDLCLNMGHKGACSKLGLDFIKSHKGKNAN
ncbi:MAG: hypothetical protein MR902_01075 [Campylobacter sp.]|nr:hypothetical protein [Campylobacter sp.]